MESHSALLLLCLCFSSFLTPSLTSESLQPLLFAFLANGDKQQRNPKSHQNHRTADWKQFLHIIIFFQGRLNGRNGACIQPGGYWQWLLCDCGILGRIVQIKCWPPKIITQNKQRERVSTHCHHSLALKTENSGCHSQHCYMLSSSTHTRCLHVVLPETRLWWRWCGHAAMSTYLYKCKRSSQVRFILLWDYLENCQ